MKTEHADDEHDAARPGQERPVRRGTAAQIARRRKGRGGEHDRRGCPTRCNEREAREQQRADAGGAGDAPDTEKAVEVRHHPPVALTLDDDGLHVDDAVDAADGGAEDEEREAERQRRREPGEQRQHHGDDDRAGD